MPNVNVAEVRALYERLCRYVGWTDRDAREVRGVLHLVQPHFPALVDDFYDTIQREPETARVITHGQEQVARLKISLRHWLEELFSGDYEDEYILQRWRVGKRHVDIGLSQVYTTVALSRLRQGLLRVLHENWDRTRQELLTTISALHRRLDLDLALIEDAYRTEYFRRQQRVERLATIGQVAGGISHELRNPLNVIKTSVYFLLHARSLSDDKRLEHLHRIERQVGLADHVITALNDFARLPVPQLDPVQLSDCVQEVLHDLELPAEITTRIEIPAELPPVLADQRQLMIALRNLICNARDAMPQGGTLTIAAALQGEQVQIEVRDTGIGMSADTLQRILEPLFSTKARGIGLGLSITRAILEKHLSPLTVTSEVGCGSTFAMSLPRHAAIS